MSSKLISMEQGDINQSPLRAAYHHQLTDATKALIEEDAKYFLHQALSTPVMNALSKTEGPFIYDMEGKAYLDLHGNGVHNAGFSNPYVIQKIIEQLKQSLAFTPRRYTNVPAIELAKKLVAVTPKGLNRVLFCPGGSEAIEMAVMLAKQVTGKWKTLSFWDSYHGTGFQSAALGGEEHFTTGQGPMVPGAFHVEFPNYYRNPWQLTHIDDIDEAYLRQIKIILQRNPDMAAVIGEPISATPVVPSANYWKEVQSLCHQYNMLLIFDEIIEGFGRTGKMFACEHFVTPDVLVLGKTLGGGIMPFAGIVTKEQYNILQHRSIGHFTHEKNPLCCTAGLATIDYIQEHQLVQNAETLGQYLMDELKALQDTYPIIGNIAGKGFHIGIDLVKNKTTKERAVQQAEAIMYHCMQQGVAFKIIEGNIITMRPALTITKDHCNMIIDALRNAFEKVKLS
ncbi:(R)-1-hydroxy-2-aminoethylphosphonate ammonia-lyase [Limnovirga soli]|uniref:Aspartate aminotransferase family protein n=1 Tax=Limnovirga soli TaxID=2656915 RepID=A0A8J8JSZ4_9BACT|nr:aspartate aminotransferase family protein [Limnovirga soli]NNV54605.1 aspartate aminotransferase family protein [Limnovirga soli]